jgi:RNA polymerase sigma factor (TIGR02999 family)
VIVSNLTLLIERANEGDAGAKDEVFAAAYPELRRMAHSRLRGGGRNVVIETTALVHEAYLRFVNLGELHADSRPAFFAYASRVMRSVIIDTMRELQAERRGGEARHVTLDTKLSESIADPASEILSVHHALLALEDVHPRLAKIAEMRYFGGYTETEIAEALGIAERTVRREWEKARLLLLELVRT